MFEILILDRDLSLQLMHGGCDKSCAETNSCDSQATRLFCVMIYAFGHADLALITMHLLVKFMLVWIGIKVNLRVIS